MGGMHTKVEHWTSPVHAWYLWTFDINILYKQFSIKSLCCRQTVKHKCWCYFEFVFLEVWKNVSSIHIYNFVILRGASTCYVNIPATSVTSEHETPPGTPWYVSWPQSRGHRLSSKSSSSCTSFFSSNSATFITLASITSSEKLMLLHITNKALIWEFEHKQECHILGRLCFLRDFPFISLVYTGSYFWGSVAWTEIFKLASILGIWVVNIVISNCLSYNLHIIDGFVFVQQSVYIRQTLGDHRLIAIF